MAKCLRSEIIDKPFQLKNLSLFCRKHQIEPLNVILALFCLRLRHREFSFKLHNLRLKVVLDFYIVTIDLLRSFEPHFPMRHKFLFRRYKNPELLVLFLQCSILAHVSQYVFVHRLMFLTVPTSSCLWSLSTGTFWLRKIALIIALSTVSWANLLSALLIENLPRPANKFIASLDNIGSVSHRCPLEMIRRCCICTHASDWCSFRLLRRLWSWLVAISVRGFAVFLNAVIDTEQHMIRLLVSVWFLCFVWLLNKVLWFVAAHLLHAYCFTRCWVIQSLAILRQPYMLRTGRIRFMCAIHLVFWSKDVESLISRNNDLTFDLFIEMKVSFVSVRLGWSVVVILSLLDIRITIVLKEFPGLWPNLGHLGHQHLDFVSVVEQVMFRLLCRLPTIALWHFWLQTWNFFVWLRSQWGRWVYKIPSVFLVPVALTTMLLDCAIFWVPWFIFELSLELLWWYSLVSACLEIYF